MPQFETVSGNLKLADIVGVGKITPFEITWDDIGLPVTWEGATQIQVPKAGVGYNVYYYCKNAYTEDPAYPTGEVEGWADVDGTHAPDVEFTQGVSVWFKNATDATPSFDVSGAVLGDDAAELECPNSFKLRGNPFPVETKLNDVTYVGDKFEITWDDIGLPVTWEGACQIQVPKDGGVGYNVYYYCTNAYTEDPAYPTGEVEGWADVDGNHVPNAKIPLGVGFWAKGGNNAFTLTFDNPTK